MINLRGWGYATTAIALAVLIGAIATIPTAVASEIGDVRGEV